jgi:hypothetical protein
MAIISFNNQALSTFGQTPSNLAWSLSSAGTYKTVELFYVSPQVRGLAFNTLTAPESGTGVSVTLAIPGAVSFRVDRAYNGQTMAVIYTDGSSALFTCLTSLGLNIQSLTANAFDTSYPEIKRLWHLGYR